MGNFEKIKAEYRLRAILLSAVLAVCCGVFLSCLVLLIIKLCGVDFFWAYYLLIGAGVAAATYFALYFILRPDDTRLAKKLDGEYALNQKVQTMIEYSADPSVMAKLQREQADGLLAPVAKRKLRFEGVVKYVFIPVLALAMLFTAVFIPAKKVDADEPYEITEYQKASVDALIADVKSSDLDGGVTLAFVEILTGLSDALTETALQSEMRKKVVAAVELIDGLIADLNTYLKLGNLIVESEDARTYAYALSDGANAYKGAAYRLGSMESVKNKQDKSEEAAFDNLDNWLKNFVDRLPAKDENDTRDTVEVMSGKLIAFSASLTGALEAAAQAYAGIEDDPLYKNIAAVSNVCGELGATAGYTESSLSSDLLSRVTKLSGEGAVPLSKQSYNLIMNDYVRSRLGVIFGVTLPEWITEVAKKQTEGEGGGGEGDGEESSGGAGGKGEINFGGAGVVYDPETDKQKDYQLIVNRYKDAANERIKAAIERGELAGELAAYITDYFNKITSSQENK